MELPPAAGLPGVRPGLHEGKPPRQSCSKPGDGFRPWNFSDRTGFQFSFPSIRFSLPGFLDFGV